MAIGDIYRKPGATNPAQTLVETTLGNTAATPVTPPYLPGQSGAGQLPEAQNLVDPIIANGQPSQP